MGNFSRDTFNKLKHYVGVRLQQGVPIVDADWNEAFDIRKYELQAFLKWFVGNGVPEGNDGFLIVAVTDPDPNDFVITAGRCLVDGWDVINESDLRYSEEPLYDNPDLADAWKVAPLDPLETPEADRTYTVYLDVWEREVDAAEDSDLVNPAIGLETCVRLKREWVVRVAENATTPPEPPKGHVFYPLATLNRTDQAVISAEAITDLRLTGLSVISLYDVGQIVSDAYGTGYTLDHDGQPNLKVSLREAINAMLRGGLPGTPEEGLTTDAASDSASVALEDSNGDIWVFWNSSRMENYDIFYNCYNRASGEWEGPTQLTEAHRDYTPFALEDNIGDIWVFWYSTRSGNDIWYNRYNRASGRWEGDTQLTEAPEWDYTPFAIKDSEGDIWVFWESKRSGNSDIWYNRYIWARKDWEWEEDKALTTDTEYDGDPFAIEDSAGDIWVFWQSKRSGNYDIWYNRYNLASGSWEDDDTQLTTDDIWHRDPFAIADSRGDIWVFWKSTRRFNDDIWYKRYSRDGGWGPAVQLTTAPESDSTPFALEDSSGDIWVFWTRLAYGNYDVFYRKLIPAI